MVSKVVKRINLRATIDYLKTSEALLRGIDNNKYKDLEKIREALEIELKELS